MTTDREQATLQLIVSLASAGDNAAAARLAGEIMDKAVAIEAWRAISRLNANLQRWDVARVTLKSALQNAPESRELRLESALLEEQAGEHAAALAKLEELAHAGIDTPQLALHLARGLQFATRDEEAEALLLAGLARWPVDIPLHQQLAQLRWRRGADQAATAQLERAIESHPRELALRLVAADLLRNAGHAQRALELLGGGLAVAPESPAFLTSAGVLLDELGRVDEALPRLRAALARAPDSPAARRNLVPTLLRIGGTDEALRLIDGLIAQFPDDQQLLAWRATTLRVAGDAAYPRLQDYARLVREYRLTPPARFRDLAEFNAEFARAVLALHRSPLRPLAQSLRGGSQTERNLPADVPVIADFFAMLAEPIRDYLQRLQPQCGHPTDRRRRTDYRIAGSWSVQLQPGGFHTNHVHPQGWLSSAYYIELPERVAAADTDGSRAGWLQFGEPAMPRPVCAPDLYVQPAPGKLVLFPSFFWHGTVPFEEGGRRLTAAFDVLPV
jgi:tetratricopeptide (TPR) repeat protein